MGRVIVLDANVVIGVLDATNAHHARAVELIAAHENEQFVMHEVTVAEVLAGPAQTGRAAAEQVWATMLELGITTVHPNATPLEVALLRAATGLPIPDCLVILSVGKPGEDASILSFDARLAARARELGHTVLA